MPSPFPGMDPYLEDPRYWGGFHTRFVVALSAAITRVLPPGYYADVEQHVWLQAEDDPDERHPFAIPDGNVAESEATGNGPGTTTLTATRPTAEVTLPKPGRQKGPRFAFVADKDGNRVVTVIEVLSPANKAPGKDRDAYLAKRTEYLAAGTNLVELDLLRDGDRLPTGRPKPPQADYSALVSRAARFPKADVWGWTVRDSLPVLPIPLKRDDGDVLVDLRPCLDRAYDDAGYATRIDYAAEPAYRLRRPDASWAADRLKNHPRQST